MAQALPTMFFERKRRMKTDEVIDLFNAKLVIEGAKVDDVRVYVQQHEVTTFSAAGQNYVAGMKNIEVQLRCTPEGFKALAALLTGASAGEIPEPEIIAEQKRKVILQ